MKILEQSEIESFNEFLWKEYGRFYDTYHRLAVSKKVNSIAGPIIRGQILVTLCTRMETIKDSIRLLNICIPQTVVVPDNVYARFNYFRLQNDDRNRKSDNVDS